MKRINEFKERVFQANLELARKGLVLYTFGNVSGIDRERGIIVIKPSGVSYNELTLDMMVAVGMDGRVVEGNLNPSSDLKTHLVLYENFPEVGGVAHTHSPSAVAWAQAKKPIPCLGTTHADYCPGEIPCTAPMIDEAVRGEYEYETGKQIVETFRKFDYRQTPMVLVASHGPFTWGPTPDEAVSHSVVLEYLAKIALDTLIIAPDTQPIGESLLRRHFKRKHGEKAYYGQKKKP